MVLKSVVVMFVRRLCFVECVSVQCELNLTEDR